MLLNPDSYQQLHGNLAVENVNIRESGASQKHELGDVYFDHNGWKYIYSKCSGTITANNILTHTAAVDLDVVLTGSGGVAATGAWYNGIEYLGSQIIYYATGGLTPGAYKGYHGLCDDSGDAAEKGLVTFEVEDNDANELFLKNAVQVTLDHAAADVVLFHPNIVKQRANASFNQPCGVSLTAVTNNHYFWRQVTGYAVVSTVSAGTSGKYAVVDTNATAGKVDMVDNAEDLFDATAMGVYVDGMHVAVANTLAWIKLIGMD